MLPVVATSDDPRRSDLGGLVTVGDADERRSAHPVHLHHPLAEHPHQEHRAVHALRVVDREAERVVARLRAGLHRHQRDATDRRVVTATSSSPSPTSTLPRRPVSSLLTPRVDPRTSSSCRSGYRSPSVATPRATSDSGSSVTPAPDAPPRPRVTWPT